MKEILSPEESQTLLQAVLPPHLRRVIPLLDFDPEGRITARGTGTLVRFRGRHLIVTNAHVHDEFTNSARGAMTSILEPAQSAMLVRIPRPARPRPIDLRLPLLLDHELDVAVFIAPGAIVENEGVDWYDGDAGAHAAHNEARNDWYGQRDDAAVVPFFVVGFGNMSHFTDDAARIEWLGVAPLSCYAVSWDLPTHAKPQITLASDTDGPPAADLTPLEQRIVTNIDAGSARNGELVGGLSGGPALIVRREGEFLVGIIFEGGRAMGSGPIRIHARPWDRIAHAIDAVLSSAAP